MHQSPAPGEDASPGSITAQGPSQPLPQQTEPVYPVGWLSSSFLCGSLSRDHLWGYLSTLILSMTPVSSRPLSFPPFLHEERSMAGAVIPTSFSGLGPSLLKRVTSLTPMGEGWDLDEIPHIKTLLPPCLRAPAAPFTPLPHSGPSLVAPEYTRLTQSHRLSRGRLQCCLGGSWVLSPGRLPGRKGDLDDHRDQGHVEILGTRVCSRRAVGGTRATGVDR